jgi:hypothetical protein
MEMAKEKKTESFPVKVLEANRDEESSPELVLELAVNLSEKNSEQE